MMALSTHVKKLRAKVLPVCLVTILLLISGAAAKAAGPVNDSCANATPIIIPNAGYGVGSFISASSDMLNATVDPAENFAPAIFVAGLDKKSVWYKFTLSTIRSVRVTLTQPGTAIAAGDVGFAVYKTSNCMPGISEISSKLTPIATFGNTFHPCSDSGEYYIQVSSKQIASGPIFIQLDINYTTQSYDRPTAPFSFGVVNNYAHWADFGTECLSLEDSNEVCNTLLNYKDYQKSAWFTFTTPAYFDYLSVLLSSTGINFLNGNITFGYKLYKGNCAVTPIASLVDISGCDSLQSTGYYAGYKMYPCRDLDTSTTYTIQIFCPKSFIDDLRLGITVGGTSPTRAPTPTLATVPSPNAIGILPSTPAGAYTAVSDVLACNSRLAGRGCGGTMPDTGLLYNGINYTLTSFVTFTLDNTCAVNFRVVPTQCGPGPLMRIFKQSLTANCADLDTAQIIGTTVGNGSQTIDCLPAGNYTLQIMGSENIAPYYYFNYSTSTSNAEQCLLSNLGTGFRVDLTAYTRKNTNIFSLATPGAYDTLNNVAGVMTPIINGGTYQSLPDTFGCANTVRTADTTCSPTSNKVMYREFAVADSGVITFNSFTYPLQHRLYMGDAGALSVAQSAFAFPDSIRGLTARTNCLDYYTYCGYKKVCMVPGVYTLATFGNDGDIGRIDQPSFNFNIYNTVHNSPFTAQDFGSIIDTLGPSGGTLYSDLDYWNCRDNADSINGYQPCSIYGKPATKAIYRQFYLKEPALVNISEPYDGSCNNYNGTKTLFRGRATDGLAGLTPVGNQWNCFRNAQTSNGCAPLDSGWYTVVSYASGPTFDDPFQNINQSTYGSYVGFYDRFAIGITITCRGPEFNRPYKASIDTATHLPYLVEWADRIGSTLAYPKTDTTIVFATEYFNCTLDTPFASHPIAACSPTVNRVAYYVFKTTQESYVQIDTKGYFGAVYTKDIRVDSAQFLSLAPIQPCLRSTGYIQFCKLQPGTYTLAIFAEDANSCSSVAPSIYIDKVGYSRFDFAKNAYDFGVVPPDSLYHYGKTPLDVNPLNSTRKPSNDFIYCTTGAFTSDPTESVCGEDINPRIYNAGVNIRYHDSAAVPNFPNISRRNLWYTFVVNQPGNIHVKLENKTIGKGYQYRFSVYESNVNGTLPFTTVVSSGQVDSTVAQGLTHVVSNYSYYYCANAPNEVTFYRDPCSNTTKRYYILVDNTNSYPYEYPGMKPNSQMEVSVLVDSVTLVLPKFDHYYLANSLGAINNNTVVAGATDNYSCATRDATDPTYYWGASANKTLWYKFTTSLSGNVHFRTLVNGSPQYSTYQVQLFRQVIPGDSTSTGLIIQNTAGSSVYDPASASYWANCCISPGTYYIFLTGYSQLNEYVYPEVQIFEQLGDYCSKPVSTQLNGPGTGSASVLVNCHTIGTDYGEFGPQLTCPQGANTADYKSSWFRLDIGGADTLDVTAYLNENTNASSTDIKYRLMTGNCGAMQEQSCVQDALTQNTYQCLVPGQSYYVQVFTPLQKNGQPINGDISLQLSALKHADTCAPLTNCLASANFTTAFNCLTDRTVKFVNFSTYGTDISYKWSFGYNNQTSTAVSPNFLYPATAADQTYTVKLVVTNNSCPKKDSVTRIITVPGRPYVNFGADLIQCNGQAVLLNATSFTGATYLWQDGSSNPTFTASATGQNQYFVKVDYNNCSSLDTINIFINPIIKKPVKTLVVCPGDSVLLDDYRGLGETFVWNTGSTAASFYVRNSGTYWVNIKLNNCTVRDSFIVTTAATARPLGRDTTVCLALGGYTLNATTSGATSYQWQNGSAAPTFNVTTAGLYWVKINFGNCFVRDSVIISNFAAAQNIATTASVCAGNSYTLPWGPVVNSAGIYRDTIRRVVSGCDSIIKKVTLTINAKPNLGADKSIVVCAGKTASLTAQYTTTGLTAVWTLGTTVITNPAAVTQAGVYRLIATNTSGCSDTALVTVTVNPKPTIGADIVTDICPYFTEDLTTEFITTGLTSTWTKGGTAVANPAAITAAGVYQLIVTNSFGCADTGLVTVTVNPKPNLGADKTTRICPGFTADLTTQFNTVGLTTNWSSGGFAISAPVAIGAAGVYQLIATNTAGCSDTATITVNINPKPAIGNDTTVATCNGNFVNLPALFNTAALTSNWTTGGNAVTNPASVGLAGLYQLIATNTSTCKDTAVVRVTIYTKPNIGNDTTVNICPGFSTNLGALYNTTGLTSSWTIGAVAVANPVAVFAAGNYRLIVTNSSGCTDTAFVTVRLYPKPNLGIDKTVSICPGFSTDLTSLFTTTNLTSVWSAGSTAITSPIAIFDAGIYQLIATNASGCSDTVLATVNINPKPALGNDTTVNICPGFSTDLTSLYSTTGLTSSWTTGTIAVANPAAVKVAGIYQLIVTNTSGCKDTALITVNMNPKPALGADKSISICPGFSTDLTTQYSTTGLSSDWTVGGVAVANPAAVFDAGNYRLIVTNSVGCTDTVFVAVSLYIKPNLGIDKAISICPGFSTDLTTLYNTAGLTSVWSLSNNVITNAGSIFNAGVYQLIATNASSCSDTALVTVSIYPKPALGIDKSVSSCNGTPVDLTTQFVTTALSTQWSLGGIAVANPSAIFDAGNYQLIAKNTSGCMDTALLAVTIFPKPNVGRDTTINICPGSTLNLRAQYPATGLSTSWTFANLPVANPAAIAQPGVYELIGTNSFGCTDTVLFTLTVDPNPTILITNPANLCVPQTADITLPSVTAGSSPGLVFTYWKDTATTIAYSTPTAATNGFYFIKGTNATGCIDIRKVTVTVFPLPLVDVGTGFAICPKDSAMLSAIVTNISAPVTYQWDPVAIGDIRNPTAPNTIVKPTATQQYIVTVKDTYGCNFSVSDSIIVTVQPPVVAFAGNDTIAVMGLPHQLLATGGVDYQWSWLPQGANISLNSALIANPLATINTDSILFTVIVKDIIGCVGYDTIKIKAYNGITYYVPNAFSPNNDGHNDVFIPTPVGIVSTQLFRVFNRYGELLFETNQWMKGWDGTYKGKPQPIGNYVWVLKGKGRNGRVIEMKGNVVLVR